MAISIRVTDNSSETLKELEQKKPIALEQCGLVAEAFAKIKCPVDTGNLRNSITHTLSGGAEYIGTNVEYGPYVEMGTTRTRAQPFIRPAVADHVDVYKKILKDVIG